MDIKIQLQTKPIEPDWGPVKVLRGRHAGRVGYLDDRELSKGIVYFGDFFYAPRYHLIPMKNLASVTTDDLGSVHNRLNLGMPYARKPG